MWEQILNVEMECKAVRTAFPQQFLLRNYEIALSIVTWVVTWVVFGHRAAEAGTLGILKCFGQFLPHKKGIFFGPSSGPSQERTGESGAFGLWPHPRGSSRISS